MHVSPTNQTDHRDITEILLNVTYIPKSKVKIELGMHE
jgi:hypothetical protein